MNEETKKQKYMKKLIAKEMQDSKCPSCLHLALARKQESDRSYIWCKDERGWIDASCRGCIKYEFKGSPIEQANDILESK